MKSIISSLRRWVSRSLYLLSTLLLGILITFAGVVIVAFVITAVICMIPLFIGTAIEDEGEGFSYDYFEEDRHG